MPNNKVVTVTYEQLNERSTLADLETVADQEHGQVLTHGKRLALHARKLGHVLELVFAQVHGEFGKWLEKHHISQSTSSRCRRLWEATKAFTGDQLNTDTIMNAYDRFGILRKHKNQSQVKAKATAKQAKSTTPVEIRAWLSGVEIGLELQIKKVQSGEYEYDKAECLAFIANIAAALVVLREAFNAK